MILAPVNIPDFCSYDFVPHPDQWRHPDIDLSEPVHLRVTCERCAYIREHPAEYPPIPWTTTGEHPPLSHDQVRLAAHVEDDPAMAAALWETWEAGEDRRHATVDEAKAIADDLPDADERIDLAASLDTLGMGRAHRLYRREKRLL